MTTTQLERPTERTHATAEQPAAFSEDENRRELHEVLQRTSLHALLWGLLGGSLLLIPGIYGIKKAGDARRLAKVLDVPTPLTATIGSLCGWICVATVIGFGVMAAEVAYFALG